MVSVAAADVRALLEERSAEAWADAAARSTPLGAGARVAAGAQVAAEARAAAGARASEGVAAPAPTGPSRGGEPAGAPTSPLGAWAETGKVVELSGEAGAARTSAAVAFVVQAQRAGEPVAWVEDAACGGLFPPDLAEAGVDLARLVVVRVPAAPPPGGTAPAHGRRGLALARAAELLLRSGGFGLVVVDLAGTAAGVERAVAEAGHGADVWLGRLAALARTHGARVVLLTRREAEAPSLGAVVAARLGPKRVRVAPSLYRLEAEVWKDKAGRAAQEGPPAAELRRAPWGAR